MQELPSKMFRSKSPSFELDKNYLNTILTLNDQVIKDSIKEEDSESSLCLLGQL